MFWSRDLTSRWPTSQPREARAIASYLGLAIGDALGATVEFMLPSEIRCEYGVHDQIRGGGWLRLRRGQVTDDTTMSLALGEAILTEGQLSPMGAAKAFDRWMRGKPVDVGNTVRRGIVRFRQSGQPESPPSPHDAGNGACMRTLPVALFAASRDDDIRCAISRQQAHVTHHNPLSDAACDCVNRMIAMALEGADSVTLLKGPVTELIRTHPEFRFRGRRRDNPSGYIVDTLQAVFQSVFETDNFRDCLIDVVNRGGDADSTGAIAGAIAGALYGMEAVPNVWLKALDQDIADRCADQAVNLLRLGRKLAGITPERHCLHHGEPLSSQRPGGVLVAPVPQMPTLPAVSSSSS